MNDPSYIYLLSSLNISTFSAPGHVDHPGTPVQIIGALTIRALHPTLRGERLAQAVLSYPESNARAISVVLIASAVLASFAAGAWLFTRIGRIDAVIFTQIGPLLFSNVLAGYSGVRPEPLLIATVHLWLAALIAWSEGRFDLSDRRKILLLAALGGIGVAIKYTFIPLLFIPLVLARNWRATVVFVVGAATSFLICVSPAYPQFRRLASWAFRLAVRDGVYGRGQIGIGPAQGWLSATSETLQSSPVFASMLFATAVILGVTWLRRNRAASHGTHWRLGVATAVGLLAATVMVAKQSHGSSRYLLAAASCSPLAIYAVWRHQAVRWNSLTRRWVQIAALAIAGALAISATNDQLSTMRNARADATLAHEWIATHLAHEIVVPYFGASSIPFALAQAEIYAGQWAKLLAQIYPDVTVYELWGVGFRHNFSTEPTPPPTGVFYLTGAPLAESNLVTTSRAMPGPLELIWTNEVEAVYRVQPRSRAEASL